MVYQLLGYIQSKSSTSRTKSVPDTAVVLVTIVRSLCSAEGETVKLSMCSICFALRILLNAVVAFCQVDVLVLTNLN